MSEHSPLAVVGTVAIDAIETPYGKKDQVFGGSAAYFSYVASFFTRVALVAVVGQDFPLEYRRILEERPIDLSHLHTLEGKTFAWKGKYTGDMNMAQTLATDLNTLLDFNPELHFEKHPEFLFLANIDPNLQLKVLDQVHRENLKYVACDTMNFWIQTRLEDLHKVFKRVDCLILNDGEARMLTEESNLIKAARAIAKMGPKHVLIKKGEHGALFLYGHEIFSLPAYPIDKVSDPTGAGDTFAGGFMGYLALTGDTSFTNMKKAVAMGTIVASFTVQDFGLDAVRKITRADLDERLKHFQQICSF
ncbi:MAG: sugar kinase [Candidatus Omnitrophica bacterium]|nr:sugar kinase [Candidatus Omnitrophota bacterium]